MMNDCCRQPANLRVVEQTPDTILRQCVVCGCKHREMVAEPGVLFAKAK